MSAVPVQVPVPGGLVLKIFGFRRRFVTAEVGYRYRYSTRNDTGTGSAADTGTGTGTRGRDARRGARVAALIAVQTPRQSQVG